MKRRAIIILSREEIMSALSKAVPSDAQFVNAYFDQEHE